MIQLEYSNWPINYLCQCTDTSCYCVCVTTRCTCVTHPCLRCTSVPVSFSPDHVSISLQYVLVSQSCRTHHILTHNTGLCDNQGSCVTKCLCHNQGSCVTNCLSPDASVTNISSLFGCVTAATENIERSAGNCSIFCLIGCYKKNDVALLLPASRVCEPWDCLPFDTPLFYNTEKRLGTAKKIT